MRLPFVLRSDHEERVADLKAVIAMCDADLKEERERSRDLTEKLHSLRVLGANPERELAVAAPKAPDPVTQAIIAKAGRDPLRRDYYRQYVAEQRSLNVAEQEIADAILAGVDGSESGVPG